MPAKIVAATLSGDSFGASIVPACGVSTQVGNSSKTWTLPASSVRSERAIEWMAAFVAEDTANPGAGAMATTDEKKTTPASLSRRRNGSARCGHLIRPEDVDLEVAPSEGRGLWIVDRVGGHDRRGVDEQVQAAQVVDELFERSSRAVYVANIERQPTQGRCRGDCGVEFVGVATGNHHMVVRREQTRHGQPNARSATRDQNPAFVQLHIRPVDASLSARRAPSSVLGQPSNIDLAPVTGRASTDPLSSGTLAGPVNRIVKALRSQSGNL
jgi:hypothetical protein